jgi:LPS-assembly protein
LGNSTRIGYFVRLPVYIALSNTNDATLSPMFTTDGGDVLEGEYRARWNNGGLWLQGSAAYSAQGGLGGSPGAQEYGHLFGAGRIALSDHWRTGFDVQTTTNNAYMRYYDISYLDRLVNDLFVENMSGRSRFNLAGYYFQGLRSTDQQRLIPYVLPNLDFSYIPLSNIAGGQFRFDVNSAYVAREQGPDSQRLTGEMRWRLPLIFGGGQLWTIIADARGDVFHVTNNDLVDYPTVPTASHVITRGIPYLELDWRWPFIAQGRGGRSYVLEPIAQIIGQPYGGNPAGLPLEDGDTFEIDDNNIFSANHLPGYGLVESGPRANVGFMAEALFPGGEVQGLVGQTYRERPDPIFAGIPSESGTASDIVGRFTIKFPHLDFTDRLDVDHGDGTIRRHEVYVTGTYGRSSMQVSYVQLPAAAGLGLPERQEINLQGDLNFYQNWQAFAAVRRDLLGGQFLDSEYGLGYEDDCLAVSLAYRRKYTFDTSLGVPPSTSVILRLNLKTDGSAPQPFSLFPQDVFATSRN